MFSVEALTLFCEGNYRSALEFIASHFDVSKMLPDDQVELFKQVMTSHYNQPTGGDFLNYEKSRTLGQ